MNTIVFITGYSNLIVLTISIQKIHKKLKRTDKSKKIGYFYHKIRSSTTIAYARIMNFQIKRKVDQERKSESQ